MVARLKPKGTLAEGLLGVEPLLLWIFIRSSKCVFGFRLACDIYTWFLINFHEALMARIICLWGFGLFTALVEFKVRETSFARVRCLRGFWPFTWKWLWVHAVYIHQWPFLVPGYLTLLRLHIDGLHDEGQQRYWYSMGCVRLHLHHTCLDDQSP